MSPAAYFRVALTYMLISMPHGTSMIFGAFQAILALLARGGRTYALTTKLTCDEKFASEFFSGLNPRGLLRRSMVPGGHASGAIKRFLAVRHGNAHGDRAHVSPLLEIKNL
jgi:hypothetical protein